MKRVLLTGATGFVGANLARRLVRDGHSVHLLVRPQHASWRIEGLRDALSLEIADLTDAQAVASAVRRIRPEWIFHLAAHGAYSQQTDPARIVHTNTLGTIHLLDACLETGFEAFVHAGSSSEYGARNHPPSESERLEPNSTYAVAKAAATHYCRHIARHRGVHAVTLRLYSVYGPYEEPTRLLPTLAVHALEGCLPPLVNPDIARDFVWVDDVVDAFLAAASEAGSEPGAIFNVGTGRQTTLRDAVEIVRRTLGLSAEPQWGSMPDRRWDTDVWVADVRRIEQELGWKARVDFEAGFLKLVDWLRRHPGMLQHYRAGVRTPSRANRP